MQQTYRYKANRNLTITLKSLLARAEIVKNNPELLEVPFGENLNNRQDRFAMTEEAFEQMLVEAESVANEFSLLARQNNVFAIVPTRTSSLYNEMGDKIRKAADKFASDARCHIIS